MVYTLLFFSSKFSLFQNSNVFGSCIIHIYIQGSGLIAHAFLPSTLVEANGQFHCSSCTGESMGPKIVLDIVGIEKKLVPAGN